MTKLNKTLYAAAQGHYENSKISSKTMHDNYMKDPLIACKMILKRNGEEAAKRYLTKRKLPLASNSTVSSAFFLRPPNHDEYRRCLHCVLVHDQ
jgi:hypothetical protein